MSAIRAMEASKAVVRYVRFYANSGRIWASRLRKYRTFQLDELVEPTQKWRLVFAR